MSYTLNNQTLPRPVRIERVPVQIMKSVTTFSGASRRDYVRQKYQYLLEFKMLTQSQATMIINIYNSKKAVNFSVSEDNLTINTSVFVDIGNRQYNTKGSQYREDFVLYLEEV